MKEQTIQIELFDIQLVAYSRVDRAIKFILENISEAISLKDLEQASGMNKYALSRAYKKKYGLSPLKWIWLLRTYYAVNLLKEQPSLKIIDIAIYTGFVSQSHLCRSIKKQYGKTPTSLRRSCYKNIANYNSMDVSIKEALSAAYVKAG